ncbi:MAG TPA: hypothetical protein VH089_10375 [Streptosporangiaceae bacterium]|nr:hypothetical protein [Streptosporangiaceae bacterium]
MKPTIVLVHAAFAANPLRGPAAASHPGETAEVILAAAALPEEER